MFNNAHNRWWSVAGGTLAMLLGSSTIAAFMFGIFAKAIGQEFGWSRTSVALGLTAYTIGNGFGICLIGAAIDKWGARWTTGVMISLFGLSIAAVSLIPPSFPIFLAIFVVIGFFGSAAVMIPYAVAICAQFDKQRGLALGIINSGNGIGGMLVPIIAVPLLEKFGWRTGYVSFGLMAALIPVLCLLLLVRVPEGFEAERKSKSAIDGSQSFQFLRTRHFWLLFTAIGLISFSTFGVTSQILPILTDRGYAPAVAGGVLSTVGLSSVCARLGTGFFVDRIFAPFVTSVIFVAAMVGIWLIVHGGALPIITTGAVLLGIGLGAEGDVITYLVSRYFPIHSFGRVTGSVWMTFAWGGAAGTLLISKSYDTFKSYDGVVLVLMGLIAVGIVCVLSLGSYIFPPTHGARAPINAARKQAVALNGERP
jgi:MFS family permease